MLYSSVLALEFSPALVEKIPFVHLRTWYLKWHHEVLVGLVMVGVVLSSLHQSFLGALYLMAKGKLYPLWYSPYLTTLFYLSAIPAGLAVTIMALYLCIRSLNVKLDTAILSELSRVIAPMLALYGVFRFVDLSKNGALAYLWMWREETLSFWLEIALLRCGPSVPAHARESSKQPAVSVLDLLNRRCRLHDEPAQRLHHRTSGELRCLLHSEMAGVRMHACDADGCCLGLSLRSHVPRHPAKECTEANLDGEGNSGTRLMRQSISH